MFSSHWRCSFSASAAILRTASSSCSSVCCNSETSTLLRSRSGAGTGTLLARSSRSHPHYFLFPQSPLPFLLTELVPDFSCVSQSSAPSTHGAKLERNWKSCFSLPYVAQRSMSCAWCLSAWRCCAEKRSCCWTILRPRQTRRRRVATCLLLCPFSARKRRAISLFTAPYRYSLLQFCL